MYLIDNLVKYKYSLIQISEFYNKSNSLYDEKPKFKVMIEEICNDRAKILHELYENEKKDRSKTFNGNYEFKTHILKDNKSNLPKNNPLQNIK